MQTFTAFYADAQLGHFLKYKLCFIKLKFNLYKYRLYFIKHNLYFKEMLG